MELISWIGEVATYLHYVFPNFRDVGKEEEGEDAGDNAEGAHCYTTIEQSDVSSFTISICRLELYVLVF